MHWGTEYSHGVSQSQTDIANYLSSLGVNLIIGAHPHVVEPVEYINEGKTFVIYSLGNFISAQKDEYTNDTILLNIEITKRSKSGRIMVIYINGMSKEETTNLTLEMAHSGDVLDLSIISENG